MSRAHFSKAVIRRVSGAPADGTFEVYQSGTATPLGQKVYAAATGTTELANPVPFTNGQVSFFLDRPARVRLVITPTGSPAQTFDNVDVLGFVPTMASDNKPAGDLPATYSNGISFHTITTGVSIGYPIDTGTVVTERVGTGRTVQTVSTVGQSAGQSRRWTRTEDSSNQSWGEFREHVTTIGATGLLARALRMVAYAAAGVPVLTARITGETGNRFQINSGGAIGWTDPTVAVAEGDSGVLRTGFSRSIMNGRDWLNLFNTDHVGGLDVQGQSLRVGSGGSQGSTREGLDLVLDSLFA